MSILDSKLKELEQALKSNAFETAVAKARAILVVAPENVTAARLLGAALRGSGNEVEAREILTALAARVPDDPYVQNSLGVQRRALGDLEGARAAFSRACMLAPDLPPIWFNYALVLFMLDEVEAALRAIDHVIALAPGMSPARMIRADMLREQGRTRQVTAEYRAVIERRPHLPWPWFGLSNLKNVPMTADDIKSIRSALLAHPDSGDERTALQFALAKALDDNALYAEAFAALEQANREVRLRVEWNEVKSSAQMDALLAAFASSSSSVGVARGREVIFIVSLPRSGSTLVEQILASHRQVEGAGEHAYANDVIAEEERRRGRGLADWAAQATPEEWARLGERYLEVTASNRVRKPRSTDKALGNWRIVGALLAMLPDARVVVCRRDPVETCFSCYRQWFVQDPHHYAYDLHELGAYWHEFDRACRFWKAQHPDRVYDLVHEDLIADQEAQTRRLLDFCDLEFDPACLQFHTTERNIKTISAAQVREPLRRDTAHAANYGALLDPLRTALGQSPGAEREAK
jgi:Flp pilus assembly protein TadD